MFEDYFVASNVAVALRNIGFDEPCMGFHEHYTRDEVLHSKMIINYSNLPIDPEAYNSTIRQAIKEKPGLIKQDCCNSTLAQWQYAAPLWDQLFNWLVTKGIHVHCYEVPALNEQPRRYGVNLFNMTGKQLWPNISLDQALVNELYYTYEDKLAAWRHGSLAACKIIKDGNQSV